MATRAARPRLEPRLALELEASALAAANLVVPDLVRGKRRPQELLRKGEGDFVTAVDHRAERRMRRFLRERHPEHGFLGEEGGGERLDAEYVWVVDPIDGTSNFGRGLASFAISVACVRKGQPVAAALVCWPEGATYSAALGRGARRNGRRLVIPRGRSDDGAILGVQWIRGAVEVPFLGRLLATGARIRVLGSTVVQYCEVARGSLDANVQEQGRIWDLAACGLVATEAGAALTDFAGRPLLPFPNLSGEAHYPSVVGSAPVVRRLVRALAGLVVSPA